MDTILYSPSAGGFFNPAIHGDAVPADAVPVTWKEHHSLLDGQATGMLIMADEDGRPFLAAPPPPAAGALAAAARAERDRRLAASDWTQLPDAPLDNAGRAAWSAYRAALRAVPTQPGFPGDVTWPVAPE